MFAGIIGPINSVPNEMFRSSIVLIMKDAQKKRQNHFRSNGMNVAMVITKLSRQHDKKKK